MIYLAHPNGSIAACEEDATAQRAEARGFVRCSDALHRALWKHKNARAMAAMMQAARGRYVTAPLARAVGGWVDDI